MPLPSQEILNNYVFLYFHTQLSIGCFLKIIHLNEVQATITGNKSYYFFAILDYTPSTCEAVKVHSMKFYPHFFQNNSLGVRSAAEGVGLQRSAQVGLLILFVMPLLIMVVAAEFPSGTEPTALP
uniref:Uncharacterized protein n=1 Tax=Accipiter nisus TaxID=211598 RepID=A0A8B9MPX2_9AVES